MGLSIITNIPRSDLSGCYEAGGVSNMGLFKDNLVFSSTEGVFLDVIGTKILRLLLHDVHNHLRQQFFYLDLRFLQTQLKVGGDLVFSTLSLCLPLKVALIVVLLHFINI
jgi:hypothetical protein